MAWWDHEELKAHEDRSDKYKLAFPNEYTEEELVDAFRRTVRKTKHSEYNKRIEEIDKQLAALHAERKKLKDGNDLSS